MWRKSSYVEFMTSLSSYLKWFNLNSFDVFGQRPSEEKLVFCFDRLLFSWLQKKPPLLFFYNQQIYPSDIVLKLSESVCSVLRLLLILRTDAISLILLLFLLLLPTFLGFSPLLYLLSYLRRHAILLHLSPPFFIRKSLSLSFNSPASSDASSLGLTSRISWIPF